MDTIQVFLQTIWDNMVILGWVKVLIAVVGISILSRFQNLMGLLAFALFIAYLAGWLQI